MSEIRASALKPYSEEGEGNPLLVARDEWGILRPVTRLEPCEAEFVGGHLKGHGKVLVLILEVDQR